MLHHLSTHLSSNFFDHSFGQIDEKTVKVRIDNVSNGEQQYHMQRGLPPKTKTVSVVLITGGLIIILITITFYRKIFHTERKTLAGLCNKSSIVRGFEEL